MSATELKGIWLDLRDVSEVALTLCRGGVLTLNSHCTNVFIDKSLLHECGCIVWDLCCSGIIIAAPMMPRSAWQNNAPEDPGKITSLKRYSALGRQSSLGSTSVKDVTKERTIKHLVV